MDIINWIMEHWLEMLAAATSLVTAASLVTRWTDTPADDRVVGKIYKVIEAIALVTGKAKQLPGQGTSTKEYKVNILFLPLLLLVLTVSCAANLTPRERAQATGYEVGQAYQDLYANYVSTNDRLQAAGETMPEGVAASMDNLKRAIIAYNDLVIVWADTNSTGTPAGLDILGSDIVRLIADISTTLMQFKEE